MRSILAFTLLFGALFVPTGAVEAGLLTSLLFGGQAYADVNTVSLPELGSNSQNPENALQVSGSSRVEDTKILSSATDSTGTALIPLTGPNGVSDGTDTPDPSLDQTSVYVVRNGDNIATIAKMFGVSVNTILWANDMKKGDKLSEGDVLLILPFSGLEHTVGKGQTLQSIAKLYKADINEIIQNNDIENGKIAVGDKLFIPNGEKAEEGDKPIKNPAASAAKDKKYYETHSIKNLAGYYINPVSGARKSQGLHDGTAVDLAIKKGTPILASAAGRVKLARNGYNGGYGNLVIISHPDNGTETLYAHQSKIAVSTGAEVYQGQVIGYVGSTGRSTGPHLHFEVHGARNPGVDNSWKY